MAENQDKGTELVEPNVVEVENFEGTIDPDNSLFDADGNVIQYVDTEKNITYRLKGKEDIINELMGKEEAQPEPITSDKGNDSTGGGAGTEPTPDNADGGETDDGEPEGFDPEKYSNYAEYILRKTGYDLDEIDLGDGVGKVKISELTHEQQLAVISQEFDQTIAEYEEALREAENKQPELKFEDPMANQVLEYLKEGGDIRKLAKEILSKDPVAQAKMLSDEEVVKLALKKQYPTFTDEEIAEELKDMGEKRIARYAKAYRAQMEKEQPDISNLTEEMKAAKALELQRAKEEFEAEVAKVREEAAKITEIGGIPVNKKIMDYLLAGIIPKDFESDSEFIQELNGNPKALIEYRFWKTYGKAIQEKTAQHYYEKGLRDANAGKEKLSDEPVRTYQYNGSGKKKSNAPKSLDEIDFDKFLNDGTF